MLRHNQVTSRTKVPRPCLSFESGEFETDTNLFAKQSMKFVHRRLLINGNDGRYSLAGTMGEPLSP